MGIVPGSIVKAIAGRDSGKFFMVMTVDGTEAFIVDGKTRKLEKPKKKKLKHLLKTNKQIPVEQATTNNKIRKMICETAKQFPVT